MPWRAACGRTDRPASSDTEGRSLLRLTPRRPLAGSAPRPQPAQGPDASEKEGKEQKLPRPQRPRAWSELCPPGPPSVSSINRRHSPRGGLRASAAEDIHDANQNTVGAGLAAAKFRIDLKNQRICPIKDISIHPGRGLRSQHPQTTDDQFGENIPLWPHRSRSVQMRRLRRARDALSGNGLGGFRSAGTALALPGPAVYKHASTKDRSVAQPGRALLSGGRGRRFKSSRSDHLFPHFLAFAGQRSPHQLSGRAPASRTVRAKNSMMRSCWA